MSDNGIAELMGLLVVMTVGGGIAIGGIAYTQNWMDAVEVNKTVKAGDRIAFTADRTIVPGKHFRPFNIEMTATADGPLRAGETCKVGIVPQMAAYVGSGRVIEIVGRASAPEQRWLVRWSGSTDLKNVFWKDWCPTGALLLVSPSDLAKFIELEHATVALDDVVRNMAASGEKERAEEEARRAKIDAELRSVAGYEKAIAAAQEDAARARANRKAQTADPVKE